MLEDQDAILTQQLTLEDKVDDLLAALKVVGGVGEDQIELLGATLQIEEYVGFDGVEIAKAEALSRLADEIVVHGVDLDRGDGLHTARGELVADGAGAREEIEYFQLLEIEHIAQHVEKVFLGKVGGGACAKILGRVDDSSSVCAADDSHIYYIRYRVFLYLIKSPPRQRSGLLF